MNAGDFKSFVAEVRSLSTRQRAKLFELLKGESQYQKTVELIEQAASNNLSCPRCRSSQYHLHGHAHGLQRYRCTHCGRTYNALTGTPMAWLRYKDRWLDFADCMLNSYTVRRAASRCDIHKSTSFRWRHRFLALSKTDRPQCLHGITEADEMYLLESEKGARHLDRPPRKRGGSAKQRGTSHEQVCILVARDRTGQTLDFITGKGPVSKAQLKRCLMPVIDKEVLLVSDANASYRYFALDNGISHRAINLRAGVRVMGAIHIQNVNAYHSRFRGWLARFHGVATAYLQNYLAWRWIIDAKRITHPAPLLRAAIGDFPHFART